MAEMTKEELEEAIAIEEDEAEYLENMVGEQSGAEKRQSIYINKALVVPRVWEWIKQQCLKFEWFSAANVAEFLAGEDMKMWGGVHRYTWLGKQKYLDLYMKSTSYPANFLVAVARYRDFKSGCMASDYCCENCAMVKEHGECNQRGSVSHLWQYVLEQDSGEKVDEELQEYMKENLDWICVL